MSDVVIFDTSVLVDEARKAATARGSSQCKVGPDVVGGLAELLRGVTAPAEHKFLRALAKKPLGSNSDEREIGWSCEILAKIRAINASSRTNCAACISTFLSLLPPALTAPVSSPHRTYLS